MHNSSPRAASAVNLRSAAGAWDPVEFHDVAGTRVAVSRSGRGPAVVCLHATGHGARDYEPLAARIGGSFEVIAVDWPGQGRSAPDAAPASASRYARVLEELLPLVTSGPAILIGCSIGGAAAIEVAARRPDLVRAMVLCDTGGLVEIDRMTRFAILRMHSFFAAGARGAWWFGAAFAMYYRMVLPSKAARGQRDRIVASAREIAPVLAEAWKSFAEPQADLRWLISQIHCPVLFAWAGKDRILPWARTRPAAETFEDYRVEMFRAGHAAFLEDPDRFADSFRRFAHKIPARTPAQPAGISAGRPAESRPAAMPGAAAANGPRDAAAIGTWKQAGAA